MLTLAMALIAAPRLLLIDELSLGPLARGDDADSSSGCAELRDAGTAIVVVEQSIDLAVELADRAYFLEKGTVRYAGPTAGLLDHPELVRAVFLGAAAASASPPHPDGAPARPARRGSSSPGSGAASAAWSRSTTCR